MWCILNASPLLCKLFLDHNYSFLKLSLPKSIIQVIRYIIPYHLCDFLLFGSSNFNEIANKMILDATVRFVVHTNCFK